MRPVAVVRRDLAALLTFALVLAFAQEIGLNLTFPPVGIAAYWPAAGVAIGVLWWTPQRRRPAVLAVLAATNLMGNLAHQAPLAVAGAFAVVNVVEAWAGAALLTALLRREGEHPTRAGSRWVIRGLLPAVLLSALFGALLGAVALHLAGSPSPIPSLAWTWFTADAFGALSALPAMEAARHWWRHLRRPGRRPGRRELAEGLALLILQTALCLIVLAPSAAPLHPLQFAIPMMPGVFWAVVRFGPRSTAVLLLGVNTAMVWAAAGGRGVFAGAESATGTMLTVQVLGVLLLLGSLLMADMVAARQQAEEDAGSRLLALENAMEGIALVGPDGTLQRVNAAYAALHGRDREQLLGRCWTDGFDPADPATADLVGTDLTDLLPGGDQMVRPVVRIRRPDGATRIVELTLVPEPDPHAPAGAPPVGVHCLARDVTERREAADLVDRLFRLSPELLCVLDADDRFCRVNPAWTLTLGHPVEVLLGESMLTLVHPGDLARTSEQLACARAGTEAAGVQTRYLAADGSYRWLHWNAAADDEGQLLYAVAHDITATKMTEHALAHARDEAVEASRLKSQFLATMSHEIRTPMNGVIGLSELLEETTLDQAQRGYVTGIRTAGTSLLSVINDILDFSKIEAGRISLEETDFLARGLLDQVVDVVGQAAERKGLDLCVDVDPELPEVLRGDPARLRQVLVNLVGNAVKFTDSGSVTVRVDVLTPAEAGLAAPTEAADENRPPPLPVRFEVNDTGIGMDDATLSRLFQPFTQADASTTRVYGGTGLGLVISRELVEAMGGWVGVQSAPGAGTTFRVVLPLAPGSSAPDGAEEPEQTRQRGMAGVRVLVVEDNEINQAVAVGILRRLGYEVDLAEDGVAALDLAGRRSYQAILMDCHMPRMDGYTATRRLRECGDTANVPIIAMTASALAADRDRCLAAGMNDYLAKPVRTADLDRTLRRWVAPERVRVPAPRAPSAPGAPGGDEIAGISERLAELAGDHSPQEVALVRGIARSFIDRSAAIAASLIAALETGNTALAQQYAHSLRGAAANLGAGSLAELCRRLEGRGADDEQAVALAAADLPPRLAEACASIEACLAGPGGLAAPDRPEGTSGELPERVRVRSGAS